jgi:hypothetical protein
MEKLLTKNDLLQKLRSYAYTPDDDVIRIKEKVKEKLLKCPELLYALNNKELEGELFCDDGTINAEYDEETGEIIPLGEWDRYFPYNIRPYVFIPETQAFTDNFLCYTAGFREIPRYNDTEYYFQIIFSILCSSSPEQAVDSLTGQSRADLIGAILREKFNWSNIFGLQCKIVSNQEDIKDTNYISRTIVLETTKPNGITNTPLRQKSTIINNSVRR